MKKFFLSIALLSGILLFAQDKDTQWAWDFVGSDTSKKLKVQKYYMNPNSSQLEDYKLSTWYKKNHAYDDLEKGIYGILYVCNVVRNDDREHGDCFNTFFMLLYRKYNFNLEWTSSNIGEMEQCYEIIMDSAVKADFGIDFYERVSNEADSLNKIGKGFNRPIFTGNLEKLKTHINRLAKPFKGGGFNCIDFLVSENGVGTPQYYERLHLKLNLPHIQLPYFNPANLEGKPFQYNCRIRLN